MVAGGGAIEMELSKYLRDYSRSIAGKEQLIIAAMAKALEVSVLKIQNVFHDECAELDVSTGSVLHIALPPQVIPRQLCDNAGFDATNILNKLRQKHAQV